MTILEPRLIAGRSRLRTVAAAFALLVGLGLAAYCALWVGLAVSRPYQLEYREGALLSSTVLLLRGENPYGVAHQPAYMNEYGIGYVLAVLPFAKLFGPSLQVHRLVSVMFLVSSALLLAWALRREGARITVAALGGLMLFAHLATTEAIVARPDSTGQFLMLAAVLLPVVRRFDRASLIASAALSILAYFTKAYFAISIPIVALYVFLFIGKSVGALFTAGSLTALAVTALMVDRALPAYFSNTFFAMMKLGSSGTQEYLWHQTREYSRIEAGLLAICIVAACAACREWWHEDRRTTKLRSQVWREHLFDWRRPLLDLPVPMATFALVIVSVALAVQLGSNVGAYLVYYRDLLGPFAILAALRAVDLRWQGALVPVGVVVANVIGWSSMVPPLPPDHREQWARLGRLVSAHERILNTPHSAELVLRHGKTLWDNGHTEFAAYLPHDRNFSRAAQAIQVRIREYFDKVAEDVRGERYDLVLLPPPGMPAIVRRELVTEHYRLEQTLPGEMLINSFPIEVWVPRTSDLK